MNRKLARRNIRSGLIAGATCILMFGVTFLAAAVYVHP
jgi:spermidine/putrescine-binding protein